MSTVNSLKCISLKNQECKPREVIVDNKYMAYPYSIKVNRCNGNCNNITNPYSRVCVPDITKNVTLKIFDLMTLTNKIKQIIIHESCKCVCRLDPVVGKNKQKWIKDKCRCERLVNKKCSNKFWNPDSCKCEYRAAQLTQECEEIIDNKTVLIKENKTISIKENKTVSITENKIISVNNCKPFVASSILFLSVSVIVTGLFVYFYVKSKSNVLPY